MDTSTDPTFPAQSLALSRAAERVPRARCVPPADPTVRDGIENEALALLLGAVAQGDRTALEQLYARSAARVYALALRIAQRPQTAEEVTSDVYVQVWRTARTFDAERGSPLAWLLTICRSRALDARRRADPALLMPDSSELLEGLDDDARHPHHLAEASQTRVALRRAIAALNSPQRQLLGLAFFRGLTHAELSRELGLPLGTVKSQMRQALSDLRRALPSL